MTYLQGLQKAKEIVLSLSVQPPQNSGEAWLYGFKASALIELQTKACEYIDQEIQAVDKPPM